MISVIAGELCHNGCTVGDGMVAFAIAFGLVGFFWAIGR